MLNRKLDKANMVNFILDMDEHIWIRENKYISLHMEELLERLPLAVLKNVFIQKSIKIYRRYFNAMERHGFILYK